MEVKSSPFDHFVNTAVSVHEGELGLPGELPGKFSDKVLEMRGQQVKLLLEKRLCATDVNKRKGWLSMPEGQLSVSEEDFLTETEIQTLNSKNSIAVSLIEPCREVCHGLMLRKWNNKGTFSYVLTKQWNSVAHPLERNELKVDVLVQLWSFRVDGNLYFCLVNVDALLAAVENMAYHE